jgi:tetratricopeptide (TPR) repeat protein
LSVKAHFAILCRVLVIAVCGFAVFRSVRIAIADRVASAETMDAFQHAIRFAPDNSDLLMRMAVYRNENGDFPSPMEDELRRAARLNPLDPAPLMVLGLREEFLGNSAQAENYLVRATEIDHQFKPAWTLANYYVRRNQPEKSWPMIQRILNLDPMGFDLTPVFELCWSQDDSNPGASRKILSLIPRHGHSAIDYLQFLMTTHRAEAALEAWPEALRATDAGNVPGIETLIRFADFLVEGNRTTDAVPVWNQLVGRGFIHSGRLDPAKGASIADPEFKFEPLTKAFGWRLAENAGLATSQVTNGLRFEFDGDEAQNLQLISAFAAVVPTTIYRLRWTSDGSKLNAPRDPGFNFRIVLSPDEAITECPPLLAAGDSGTCDFVTLAETGKARIDLRYARAQGTTRAAGTLRISAVRMELAR